MMAHLRSVWTAPPASPPPPARVWRDYALIVAVALVALVEGLVSSSASWPMLLLVVAIAPTLLWRRTKPLGMLITAMAATALGVVILGNSEPIAAVFFVVLLYALSRWGSGRSIVVGVAVVLVHLWVTEAVTGLILEDVIGAHILIITVISLGLAVRFRASVRSREIEQARMLERERLARDIHDTVAHHVSAIAIRAQAGLATAASDPEAATNALLVIESEASSSLAELRTMLRVLRFDDAAELHPSPHIEDLERLTRRESGGPIVNLRLTGQLNDLPSSVMTAVYRIAQESVTNARRHATRATRVDVAVDADEQQVRLQVHDDGAGGALANPGFGITGMKERAALLGGTCTAGPARDSGWTVAAVLPRSGRPA